MTVNVQTEQPQRLGKRTITRRYRTDDGLRYDWLCECGATGTWTHKQMMNVSYAVRRHGHRGGCKNCPTLHTPKHVTCVRCGEKGHMVATCRADKTGKDWGRCERTVEGEQCSKEAWHFGRCE